MKISYDVYHPGERSAGINAFEDTVTIHIDSGDPGGEDDEFAEHMRQSLADWYDGAKVKIEGITKT
jgi:hypothetical protein